VDAQHASMWSARHDPLREGELRVFYAWSAAVADEASAERCRALLSDDERAKEQRFRFVEDRQSYLMAHALVRHVLSQQCGVAARELQFTSGEHGRPELAAPQCTPRLRFNLSHTRGLVACGVALEHDIGVDVEHVDRRLEIDRLAGNVFSERERTALYALPPAAQRERFFELWTLKESYIKAVGVGISMPLRAISIDPGAQPSPAIAFDAPLTDDAGAYFLDVRRVGASHMLAAVLRRTVPSLVRVEGLAP
jgi:4'-phosphopantetheinyl transferase